MCNLWFVCIYQSIHVSIHLYTYININIYTYTQICVQTTTNICMNRYMRIDRCILNGNFFLWVLESGFHFNVCLNLVNEMRVFLGISEST